MQASEERSRGGEEQASSGFNLWGMAARLVDDVKKNAESIVSTIAETDWTKELSDMQQSLKEDTQQLENSVFVGPRPDAPRQPAEQAADSFSFAKIGQSLVTGTREWFEQVKHTVDEEIQAACKDVKKAARGKGPRSGSSALDSSSKYSRLESEISSIQRSSSTYCDEPEDEEDFARFVATFDIERKKPEIDAVLHANAFMAELHSRIVPLIVEHHVFWQRYFYRLHKLMEQHEKHRNLVIRTNQMDQSDISWDDEPPSTARSPGDNNATPPEDTAAGTPQTKSADNNAKPTPAKSSESALTSTAAAAVAAAVATAPLQTGQGAEPIGGGEREAEGGGASLATEKEPSAAPTEQPEEGGAEAVDSQPAAVAPASESGLPPRGKQPTDSGNASSDWSVVSSPYQNTPAGTPSQADGDTKTAGASPEQSLQHEPTPTPAKTGEKAEPAVDEDEDDDDDLDLDANVPLDGVVDEEIDEDWGEWD